MRWQVVKAGTFDLIEDENGNTIAQCECLKSEVRLICAAPEMVEMLDILMEDLNSIVDNAKYWPETVLQDHCFGLQDKISKLIDKVRGDK